MHKDLKKILFTEEEIQQRIVELGTEITKDYKDKNLLVICVLRGASMFMTDLIKRIDNDLAIDFIEISSYGSGSVSSGVATIVKDLSEEVEDKDILIVEDILDTHLTVDILYDLLGERKPASITVCSLLYKDRKTEATKVRPFEKYIGFTVPDEFVVGYGLDYDQRYRNLPYIGVLKESVYN